MGSVQTEHVKCNLCGADSYSTWGYKHDVRIVKCKQCSLIYASPRLTDEELKKYYSREYFDEGDYEDNQLRGRMYELEAQMWLPIVGSNGKFLDVGCAMGKCLASLPDTFEKYGVEYSDQAAQFGRERFGLNIRTGQLSQVGIEEDFYDVVQMRGVIEHLQDPAKEVSYVHKALKMNGWFIINMTPNIGSFSGRIYRERFNQVFPKEHLYYFRRRTLEELLEKSGFEVRHVFYPYWGTPYASPIKDMVHFVWNRLTGKESPPFWKNMMAVYSQKVRSL